MKDKQARALAIVALVFMGIFVVALTMTLIDFRMLNGAIGFVALGSGVFAIMIFIALKADGRGYSLSKMKMEAELEQAKKEAEEENGEKDKTENNADPASTASSTTAEEKDEEKEPATDGKDEKSAPDEHKK